MKNIKRIYKYTLSGPKLTVVIMITIVALAFTNLLPTWTFIN